MAYGNEKIATFVIPGSSTDEVENRLRELRLWHWVAVVRLRAAATMMRSNCDPNGEMDPQSLHYFDQAKRYDASANLHIKFVQTLNDFFPVGDTAEGDEARSKAGSVK